MAGPIHAFLATDHRRLEQLLAQALADPARLDVAAFEAFRAGLLRHIAMEEKVMFPEVRRLGGGQPHPAIAELHADHALFASLMIPSPTAARAATLRELLDEHDTREEGPGGVYASCEALPAGEAAAVIARMQALPPLRISEHADGPRIEEHLARQLAARRNR